MRTIWMKYIQLHFIISSVKFISCVDSNVKPKSLFGDSQLGWEIHCTFTCLQRNLNVNIPECYEACQNVSKQVSVDDSLEFKEIHSNGTIQLICREHDRLKVRSGLDEDTDIDMHSDGALYVVKIQNIGTQMENIWISKSPICVITDLTPNTTYNVIASIYTSNHGYHHLREMKRFTTLESANHIPLPLSKESIIIENQVPLPSSEELFTSEDSPRPAKIITTIQWEPAEDLVCRYFIRVLGPNYIDAFQVTDPEKLHSLRLNHLDLDTKYTLDVGGLNIRNEIAEGPGTAITFETPSCDDLFEFDRNNPKCPPRPLKYINSTAELIAPNHYNIHVFWDVPKHQPDLYIVSLITNNFGEEVQQQVDGGKNSVSFMDFYSNDTEYELTVAVLSGKHTVDNFSDRFELKHLYVPFYDKYTKVQIATWVAFILIVSLILVLIQCFFSNRKKKTDLYSKKMYLRELTQSYSCDPLEIAPEKVELFDVLGEGAFGIVRKGYLVTTAETVAVKTLKENASSADMKEFIGEIKLMKSVGKHKNIVGILGHSTKSVENVMLMTEFCDQGNLLNYLKAYRKKISNYGSVDIASPKTVLENRYSYDTKLIDGNVTREAITIQMPFGNVEPKQITISNKLYDQFKSSAPSNIRYCNIIPSSCLNFHSNAFYDYNTTNNGNERTFYDVDKSITIQMENPQVENKYWFDDVSKSKTIDENLTETDLLFFAKQVADGMDFLAKTKIVHRDLAARNVLVCSDKTVKIADFGLSRNIHSDNMYVKSGSGRLPIKWLALESMTDQIYTSQSDVWSFGILTYEIITLGETPYPNAVLANLMEDLKNGKRMKKPPNCGQELYDLMYSCWYEAPGKRPTFDEISTKIDSFIMKSSNKTESTEKGMDSMLFLRVG